MASYGTAPADGCSLFGVGYDNAFQRLKETYLINGFERGSSTEKFVVGPYGSGKTHFLRQLQEIAQGEGCITAEVQLNKDVDFTQSLMVYKELARQIRVPDSDGYGIRNLFEACLKNVKNKTEDTMLKELVLSGWISGLDKVDFKLDNFRVMAKKAFLAAQEHNAELFESICYWLSGNMDDKSICKELGISYVSKSEQNLFARRAMLSLFQLVRHAGFKGTVVCFDEAEQGLTVDKKKTEKILSMLMSGIASIVDLPKGSALVVYALTPDIVERMETLAALQQRIANPEGHSFFEGNTYATQIKLTKRDDPLKDLEAIGDRLVEMVYQELGEEIKLKKEAILIEVHQRAKEIVETNLSVGNRRDMAKITCILLLRLYETGGLEAAASSEQNALEEDEV